jgi:ribosomal protein S24E
MKIIKVINQRENPLFNRKEAEVMIESDVAPKISEAEAFIAKEFSAHADNVKIRKIKGRFGSKNFMITANIYNSKEDKDKIEKKSKKDKKSAADNKEAKG